MFLGGQHGVLGGLPRVYVRKVYVHFRCLNKAGRSDFQNQWLESDAGEDTENAGNLSHPRKLGSEDIPQSKMRETRKMRTQKRGKCGKCSLIGLYCDWALGHLVTPGFYLCP